MIRASLRLSGYLLCSSDFENTAETQSDTQDAASFKKRVGMFPNLLVFLYIYKTKCKELLRKYNIELTRVLSRYRI